ncbi:hypothetical protein [Alteromonas sp. ASW11-130]|uniref:hypothetical protein n=1 Tax=Alteromonas sp. ASW11-130 TaxID=3015775 RepID=UPI002241F788|nr:hypothetical protein [Alteromonas sp. ASW11-130]MCW8091015.1 hypothetical protein [Alteromonas sp. ASW11-130]
MYKLFILSITIFLLSACGSLPDKGTLAKEDFGSYPDNYELTIKAWYNKAESHPTSIYINYITKPTRYWLANKIGDAWYGYLVCVTIDSKNRLGAYSGFRRDAFILQNEKVVKYIKGGSWWGEELCSAKKII